MPETEASLTKGADSSIPNLKLSQTSYNGLWTVSGRVMEECAAELRWPQCISTYKKMAKDATIAPALNLVETAIARVPWVVKIPEGYEEELKAKAEFLRQVMNDMEHPWGQFIRQSSTFNRYGFAPVEKVYRKRYKRTGSKYDDGLIGLESLPLIAQDTVSEWEWKDNGRKLKGLWQYVVEPQGGNSINVSSAWKDEFIPRKKFMLLRNAPLKDNPEGSSPLSSCWLSWKYKTSLEQFEATGVSQDLRGLKVLYIPPRYMAEDASPEDREVYSYYKNIMRNLHQNEQSGLILPQVLDDQGEQYFKFDVIANGGQKAYDTHAIIERYKKEIISCLMASQLILGQGGGGSFSLAESLQDITEMTIESKLIEIKEQLNHDLIPQLWKLNGWDVGVTPYFDFGEIREETLDEIGKFIQRVSATGNLPKTPKVINWILDQAGIPERVDEDLSVEELSKILGTDESKSGSGMEEGLNNGQGSSSGSSGDSSVSNSENT